jgi:AcrR family transcriptional regulator
LTVELNAVKYSIDDQPWSTVLGIAERRERERQALRERILDAAREMFVAQGYDAVTMRAIARRIEYSPTAIYFHFADKESLFQELCRVDFLRLGGLFARIARVADPLERLRALGQAYVEFALQHPQHYRLMFMTPGPGGQSDAALAHKGNPEEDAYGLLRQTVAEAVERGLLRPELADVDEVSQLVWAGVHGIVSLHIAKGNDAWVEWRPARDTAARLIDVTIRGMTAREG